MGAYFIDVKGMFLSFVIIKLTSMEVIPNMAVGV